MSTSAIIGIVIVALAVVGVLVWYSMTRRHQTEALQAQYGSEYDRTVSHASSRRAAEAELVKRQERVEKLDIRPLTAEQRELFGQQWHDVQEMFVDNPAGSINRADALVVEVMRTRGYPVANFEQRASDLSVHHAVFVENYRAARDIAERSRRNGATTEELRRAMVYYRELFEDLLQAEGVATDRQVERTVERDVAPPSDREVVRPSDGARARADRTNEPPVAPPSDREIR
jgi:hypothetical protein